MVDILLSHFLCVIFWRKLMYLSRHWPWMGALSRSVLPFLEWTGRNLSLATKSKRCPAACWKAVGVTDIDTLIKRVDKNTINEDMEGSKGPCSSRSIVAPCSIYPACVACNKSSSDQEVTLKCFRCISCASNSKQVVKPSKRSWKRWDWSETVPLPGTLQPGLCALEPWSPRLHPEAEDLYAGIVCLKSAGVPFFPQAFRKGP